MSIHGDVQFISQLKYKTHIAVAENVTFMIVTENVTFMKRHIYD